MMTHTAKETGQQKEQWGVGVRGDREVGRGGGGSDDVFVHDTYCPSKKCWAHLGCTMQTWIHFFSPEGHICL